MKILMMRLLTTFLLVCVTLNSTAYVGELSKDIFEPISGHVKGHRDWAYSAVVSAAQTKKPEAILSTNELHAKRVLMEADEQILINNARRWQGHLVSYLHNQLEGKERQILSDLKIRIISDHRVVAKYFPNNSEILVPSGLLVRSYYLGSIFEEAKFVPSLETQAFQYSAMRLLPPIAKKIEDRAASIMTLGLYSNGTYSITDRKIYNEYLSNVQYFYNSVFVFSLTHEICHALLKHRTSDKDGQEYLIKQESQADTCAFEKLKNWQGFPFNPISVFFVLYFEFFDEVDNYSKTRTHPKIICRVLDIGGKAIGGGSSARNKVLSTLSDALREQDGILIGIKRWAQEINPTRQISDKDVLDVLSRNCP